MKSKISKLQSELDQLYASQRDYGAHYAYSRYINRLENIKNKGYHVYRNNLGNHLIQKKYRRTNKSTNSSNSKNQQYKGKQFNIDLGSFMSMIFNKKVIGLLVIIALVVFAKNKFFAAPDKNYYLQNVPPELLYYEFYNNVYQSSVKDIDIIREKTEKGQNEARCIITLADDNLERTLYVDFYSSKFDNGWNLMSWTEYQEGEASPLVGLPDEAILYRIGSNLPFDHYDDIRDYSNLSEKTIQYEIDLSYSSKYRKASGTAFITGSFEQLHIENEQYYSYPEGTPCSYKYKYGYEYEFDDSNIKFDWYIDGSYGCEILKIFESTELEYPVFIIAKKTDGIAIDYGYTYHEKEYYSRDEYMEDYNGDYFVENNEVDINNISYSNGVEPYMAIPLHIYHLSDDLILKFTDNNVYIGGVELMNLNDE